MNTSKTALARGRTPASKPLATSSTASTRAKQAASSTAPSSSAKSTKAVVTSLKTAPLEPSSSTVKTPPPPIEEKAPAPTSDFPQVASSTTNTASKGPERARSTKPPLSSQSKAKSAPSESSSSIPPVTAPPPIAPAPTSDSLQVASSTTRTASKGPERVKSTKAPVTRQPKPKAETSAPSELSSSTVKAPPPVTAPPPIEEKAPAPTSDSLQVAAQLYPWLYMTSTLDACFQTADAAAKKDLAERAHQLAEDESDIAEERTRFHAERAVDLYDELSTDTFAETAPHIMQAFLAHGDACTRVEAAALELATHGANEPDEDAPLRIYGEMLDSLEGLHAEAVDLEASIIKLTGPVPAPASGSESARDLDPGPVPVPVVPTEDESSARAQILGVFTACLPVLRARISNLSMAQELIDGAQENLSISLRMESLGLLD